MSNNPMNQYRLNQIMTATPQQLVLMLYDRALRDLRQAKEAIEAKDPIAAGRLLVHLEEILDELLVGLDLDAGGDIALNLGRLYDYCIIRCREANVTKDLTIVDELHQLFSDFRQTWAEAMIKAKQEEGSLQE